MFIVVVHSLSHVRSFAAPWTAARQHSLSFTISWNLLRLMSIESANVCSCLIWWDFHWCLFIYLHVYLHICCCSVSQACLTLFNPINYSMPGLSVPYHFPKFAQVHFHCISDAIQLSHSLMPSSPSALNLSQHQGLFSESSAHIRWPKYWVSASILVLPTSIHAWFPLRWTGLISLLSKRLSGAFSSTIVRRHQFLGISPSLKSCSHNHTDHWEVHSLDYMDLCQQSNVSAFQYTVVTHSFPAKKQVSSDFMAAVTICSDFRAQEEICHCLHLLPFYFL